MTEAYYLSGNIASTPAEAIQSALETVHARLDWVEEAFWLGSKGMPPSLPGLPASCPLSAWIPQPGLDALILQTACHLLVSGQRRMILLVQQARTRCVAVLLVGPKAVGAHNLAPLALIHPDWTLPATPQPLVAATVAMGTTEFEPAQINWLASVPAVVDDQSAFPTARLAPRSTPGAIFQLQTAARILKKTAPLALLTIMPPAMPLRVFLLEKI
jgi:hypothetical protein